MDSTPGPWSVEVGNSPTGGDDFEGYVVVNAGEGTLKRQIAYVEAAEDEDEQEANGRLMAAAPELLSALEALVEKVEARWHEDIKYAPVSIGQYLMAARSVIEKAKAASTGKRLSNE